MTKSLKDATTCVLEWLTFNRLTVPSVGEDVYIAGWNAKWYNLENNLVVSYKVQRTHTICLGKNPLVYFSQEILKHTTTKRLVPTNVHSSFVHNNPKLEVIYASSQFIVSQIQTHLSLPCCVILDLEPVSTSPLPAGPSGFVRLKALRGHYKVVSAGRHFPSGFWCSHIFIQHRY